MNFFLKKDKKIKIDQFYLFLLISLFCHVLFYNFIFLYSKKLVTNLPVKTDIKIELKTISVNKSTEQKNKTKHRNTSSNPLSDTQKHSKKSISKDMNLKSFSYRKKQNLSQPKKVSPTEMVEKNHQLLVKNSSYKVTHNKKVVTQNQSKGNELALKKRSKTGVFNQNYPLKDNFDVTSENNQKRGKLSQSTKQGDSIEFQNGRHRKIIYEPNKPNLSLSKETGIQNKVIVKFEIFPNGLVSSLSINIQKSSGKNRIDEVIKQYITQFRFERLTVPVKEKAIITIQINESN